jgi:hypothetical protein
MQEGFYVNVNFSGSAVLKKKLFKDFFTTVSIYKNGFPHCDRTQLWGPWHEQTWICIILKKKKSCRSELLWTSGSREDFKITWLNFCKCVFISLLMNTWPFIWINLNSLYSRMICTKFYWNWPAGLWDDRTFLEFPPQYKQL